MVTVILSEGETVEESWSWTVCMQGYTRRTLILHSSSSVANSKLWNLNCAPLLANTKIIYLWVSMAKQVVWNRETMELTIVLPNEIDVSLGLCCTLSEIPFKDFHLY